MTAPPPAGHEKRRTPAVVSETDFPATGSAAECYRFLLRYAVLAPSSLNTQPWRFGVDEGGVDVYGDMRRRIPVIDPHGRELAISIGAGLFNARVAAARFRFPISIELTPAGFPDERLAHFGASDAPDPDPDLLSLFPAITRRHTNREPFLLSRIPSSVVAALSAIPGEGGAGLVVSTDGRLNTEVAGMVEEADRRLLADQEYRTSIAEWTRPEWTERADGVPATNLGFRLPTGLAPWATKVLDLSRVRAATDRNLCAEAPGLVVVTGEDSPGAWLEAGQMLERVLLTLVREGVQVSYFNMPVQIPELRIRLRSLLGINMWPQMLLRIGYCLTEPRPTPRRPLEEVLLRRAAV